jgi:hypothetical protein
MFRKLVLRMNVIMNFRFFLPSVCKNVKVKIYKTKLYIVFCMEMKFGLLC